MEYATASIERNVADKESTEGHIASDAHVSCDSRIPHNEIRVNVVLSEKHAFPAKIRRGRNARFCKRSSNHFLSRRQWKKRMSAEKLYLGAPSILIVQFEERVYIYHYTEIT